MQRVYATVYDPLNSAYQKLLGEFNSTSTPEIHKKWDGEYNTNFIIFFRHNDSPVNFVRVIKGSIVVGMPDGKDQLDFRKTPEIDREHSWMWRDERGQVWMATQEFGRYLSYLENLPRI